MKKRMLARMIIIVFLILLPFESITANAAATGATSTARLRALNAYKTFLSHSTVPVISPGKKYFDLSSFETRYYSATPSSQLRFALAYIDNDNVPELIVERIESCWVHGLYGIFTYKNGKVTRFKSGNGWDYYVGYYSKTGTFLTREVTEGTPYHDLFSVYKKNKVTNILARTVMSSIDITYYRYQYGSRRSTSFSVYANSLRTFSQGKTLTRAKFFRNTATNRNRYLR